jgi:uncharacterized membrane protein YeaQ/YmgE (transglycosylase-associated protein family)
MHIIGFLIFGLIVGLLARAIYPGPQPMGWLATAILGMVGSLVGGLVGSVLWGAGRTETGGVGFTPGGLIMSILGAIVVLWAYLAVSKKRRVA